MRCRFELETFCMQITTNPVNEYTREKAAVNVHAYATRDDEGARHTHFLNVAFWAAMRLMSFCLSARASAYSPLGFCLYSCLMAS